MISTKELALRLGVSPRSIPNLEERGLLPKHVKRSNNKQGRRLYPDNAVDYYNRALSLSPARAGADSLDWFDALMLQVGAGLANSFLTTVDVTLESGDIRRLSPDPGVVSTAKLLNLIRRLR